MKEVEKEIGLVYSTNVFFLGMAEETSGKIYDLCLYLPIVKGRESPGQTAKTWWNGVSDAAIGGGDNDTPHSANGFMALLTASYMKNVITEHYYGNTDDQSANVYTIGFSTEHQTDGMVEMANLVLNPGDSLSQASESTSEAAVQVAEAWEEYRTGGDPVVQGKLGANGDERSYHVEIADPCGGNPYACK